MEDTLRILSKLSLFQHVTLPEMEKLFADIPLFTSSYPKGRLILRQGASYNDLSILLSGIGYAEMVDVTGKVIKIEQFYAPYVFAPAVLFASTNQMPGSVIAKTDCEVLKINKENVLSLCLSNKYFSENFLTLISDKFVFISNRLSFLSFKTIKGKLAKYILTLPVSADGKRYLQHTIEELSEYFGVSRPSLSRVLIDLVNQGIISRKGKELIILHKEELLAE